MRTADQSLWRAWLEHRDGRAFEGLVRPHLRFAADFARRLGLCPADADEVVQQSLVALAQQGERPARVGLKAWLGREVLQRARMLFRSERRRHVREALVRRTSQDPMQLVETHEEVERALSTLEENSRWIVELRFLYDLEYSEISRVVGISQLGCRLRVHRAIARMRRQLGPKASMRVAILPLFVDVVPPDLASRAILTASTQTSIGPGIAGVLAMTASTKAAVVAAVAVAVALGAWVVTRERAAPISPRQEAARGVESPRLVGAADGRQAPAAPTKASGDPVGSTPVPEMSTDSVRHGQVDGVLRFADGAPAAGVLLAIGFSSEERATTDPEGRFRIERAPLGDHPLSVVGPRRYALALARVSVRPGATASVNLTIERGATLEGTLLLDPTREPVVGRLVTVRRPGGEVGPQMVQAAFGWVETDEEGRFRFDHLPRAAYRLEVQGGHGSEGREFNFEMRDETERREFVLSPARPLVLHFKGLPVTARRTTVRGTFSGYVSQPGSGLRTGFEGPVGNDDSLRSEAPPPGSWVLRVDASDLLPEMQKEVRVGTENPVEITIEVPAGASVQGILSAADGAPMSGARIGVDEGRKVMTDGEGRFSFGWVPAGKSTFRLYLERLTVSLGTAEVRAGEATRVDFRPLGSASVIARLSGADVTGGVVALWGPGTTDKAAEAWADELGRVRFTHLAGGTYRLTAFAGLGPHVSRTVEIRGGEVVDIGEITFEEAVRVPVELVVPQGQERPTYLSGTAFRDGSGPPIGVTIRIDAEGQAWLEGLSPGRWLVTFSPAGYAQVRVNVDASGAQTEKVRIELKRE